MTFKIPDIKSRWLSELTEFSASAFASQTFRGSALPGGLCLNHPGSLLPVHVACTTSPPFLPSSVGLLPKLGSGESFVVVFWQFSGLLSRCGWDLSNQQDEVSPVSSYTAIFPGLSATGFLYVDFEMCSLVEFIF